MSFLTTTNAAQMLHFLPYLVKAWLCQGGALDNWGAVVLSWMDRAEGVSLLCSR